MKINIIIDDQRTKKKEEDPRKQRMEWPTDPRMLGEERDFVLEVAFYDGTSKPDPSDPSKFVTVDHWKFLNADNVINATHASADSFSYAFYQNYGDIDPQDVMDDWDGSILDRNYGIFDRAPVTRILYSDFLANSEVLPVGVNRPNIEVELLYPETGQPATTVDLIRIFRDGVFNATADIIVDDTLKVGYKIWNPPFTVGHLRLKEITFNSVIMHIGAGFNDSVLATDSKISELEGICWMPFDTSDTDNYKVTTLPSYDAPAFEQPPVRMLSQYTTLRVFLQPRKWWLWATKRSNGDVGGVQGWGIWMRPPKDFLMPTPRKSGNWEMAHVWDISEGFDPETMDPPCLQESNAHARFSFGEAVCDSKYRNALYILFTQDPMTNIGALGGGVNDMWHCNFLAGGDITHQGQLNPPEGLWHNHFHPLFQIGGSHANETYGATGVMKMMPDLKSPMLTGTKSFQPFKDGDTKCDYYRNIKAWADTGFNQTGIDAATSFITYANSLLVNCNMGPIVNPQTWGIGAAGAKEGDLLAVIETGDGQPYYIWRKTDEQEGFAPLDTSDTDYPEDCYYYMNMPDNAVFSGHLYQYGEYISVVNCRGILEWPFSITRKGIPDNPRWKLNRLISSWGSWFYLYKQSDTWLVTPHRGTITLERPVSVIAYSGIHPNSNAEATYT